MPTELRTSGAPAARDVELVGSLLSSGQLTFTSRSESGLMSGMIVSGLKCPIEPSVRMVCIEQRAVVEFARKGAARGG